jgi:predicted kinase
MSKVIILQGCSGSGKSTYAKNNYPNAYVVSADNYFMKDGKYQFDPSQLDQAHGQCLRLFVGACENQQEIVVDNTNTSIAEIAPYYAIARAYGYDVELIWISTSPEIATKRNVHSVSLKKNEMMSKMIGICHQSIPHFWKIKKTIAS